MLIESQIVCCVGRQLEGGEKPEYIARRLIRFASEDVGLVLCVLHCVCMLCCYQADPQALVQATAAFQACHVVGLPECDLALVCLFVFFFCDEWMNRHNVLCTWHVLQNPSIFIRRWTRSVFPFFKRVCCSCLFVALSLCRYQKIARGKVKFPAHFSPVRSSLHLLASSCRL